MKKAYSIMLHFGDDYRVVKLPKENCYRIYHAWFEIYGKFLSCLN